jgi:hypothetical protein
MQRLRRSSEWVAADEPLTDMLLRRESLKLLRRDRRRQSW